MWFSRHTQATSETRVACFQEKRVLLITRVDLSCIFIFFKEHLHFSHTVAKVEFLPSKKFFREKRSSILKIARPNISFLPVIFFPPSKLKEMQHYHTTGKKEICDVINFQKVLVKQREKSMSVTLKKSTG